MSRKKKTIHIVLSVLVVVLGLAFFSPSAPASAQAGSAAELINAVNAYRAANGLEAYSVDGGLMALAQAHSEYQASIQTCTHARADGSGPGQNGISAENIACGMNLSVQDAVYYQWSDSLHLATMLGPTSGQVGAGAALAGGQVYYTLAVRRLSGEFNYVPPVNDQQPAADQQSSPLRPNLGQIVVSTPSEDGSISHIVKYGEALISIAEAYGITLSDLIAINHLDPQNPTIYEKQVLLIRVAYTQTPFMTATYTPRPPTRTPLPTRTPRPTHTATSARTPLPTLTSTPQPLVKIPSLDDLGPARPFLAYALIGIGAIGLLVVLFAAFLPEKK